MSELFLDAPSIAFLLSSRTTGFGLVAHRKCFERRRTQGRIENPKSALGADGGS
jgi:hypothetical protein